MFYTDDAKMLSDLLSENWDTGLNSKPVFVYDRESLAANAYVGYVEVDRLTRTNAISAVDYRTIDRNSYLSVKVATRYRHDLFEYAEEVYRILLDMHRRAGPDVLGGWEFLEIQNDREGQDLSGFYTVTFDIKLTRYHAPIPRHGFGPRADQFRPQPEGVREDDAGEEESYDESWPSEGDVDPGECSAEYPASYPPDGSVDPGDCASEYPEAWPPKSPVDPCDGD